VETNKKLALMRQIHAAIDHLHKAELESAITLPSAAEGVLPDKEKPHLFQKIKKMADSFPADPSGQCSYQLDQTWHSRNGKHFRARCHRSGNPCDLKICGGTHGAQSKEMKTFSEWAIERLQAGKSSN
jgi:hypothetical protein